jgi:hypothetical protein
MVEQLSAALYIDGMPRLTTPSSLALLALAAVALLVWWLPVGESATQAVSQAAVLAEDAKQVEVEITIEDADSGLSVQAKRRVAEGSTALEAMRATVAIETKEFQGLGLFVTSLCGVKPAAGKFWSPEVDGERSQVGIAQIKLKKNTRLNWKTREAKSE